MIVDNFDVFEDRVKSLLERWRKFHDETSIPNKAQICINGCLNEINDGFTQSLLKGEIDEKAFLKPECFKESPTNKCLCDGELIHSAGGTLSMPKNKCCRCRYLI